MDIVIVYRHHFSGSGVLGVIVFSDYRFTDQPNNNQNHQEDEDA
jgi:hypothetical protein